MNRGAKWGVVTALTIGLMLPLYWQGAQPFGSRINQVNPNPARANDQARSQALTNNQDLRQKLRAKKAGGNEKVVAKDIARTAALCVRDCRTMLTEISNELAHAKTPAERRQILEHHMKIHDQFVSLTLNEGQAGPMQVGRALRPDLQTQANKQILADNFYVSDLYRLPQANDPKERIGMTLGVPVVGDSKVTGSLVADVEMGHLMQVLNTQDSEMGTKTSLVGLDGHNESRDGKAQRPRGGISTKQVTERTAQSKVDGTAWKVNVTAVQNKGPKHRSVIHDEVLVRFNHALSNAEIGIMTTGIRGNLVRSNSRNTYIFHSDTMSQHDMIAYFRGRGAQLAEPHSRLRQNEVGQYRAMDRVIEQPNDVFYAPNQWNLPLIKADKAWQVTTGDPNVIIAVVDTGVDLNHPEFQGKLVPGWNMIAGNDQPQDDNGHGTHVAGVIAARTNNTEGIAGIDWGSKIMPIKTMDAEGSGSVVDIADGITWAVDHGASVINLSLGEYNDSDYLHDAIKYAHDKGVVVCAAMGNDGIEDPSYPAVYPEAIAVAANDETNETATFSNFGEHTSVSAPGVAIPSTYPNRRYVALSGTSMATPHVAGLCGLIKSINPDLSADDVKKILQDTAQDLGPEGKDEYYGYGEIDVAKAVQAAKETVK